jgi:hypothetical protein
VKVVVIVEVDVDVVVEVVVVVLDVEVMTQVIVTKDRIVSFGGTRWRSTMFPRPVMSLIK